MGTDPMPPDTFPPGSLGGTYEVNRPLSAGGNAFLSWALGRQDRPPQARADRMRMSPEGKLLALSLLRVTLSDLLVAKGLG